MLIFYPEYQLLLVAGFSAWPSAQTRANATDHRNQVLDRARAWFVCLKSVASSIWTVKLTRKLSAAVAAAIHGKFVKFKSACWLNLPPGGSIYLRQRLAWNWCFTNRYVCRLECRSGQQKTCHRTATRKPVLHLWLCTSFGTIVTCYTFNEVITSLLAGWRNGTENAFWEDTFRST